jgi:hypothetical protein
MVIVVGCDSHKIPGAVPGRGPGSVVVQFGRALAQAVDGVRIVALLADAHFDAEWVHRVFRSHGIHTIIPQEGAGRRTSRWQRAMGKRFGLLRRKYGQRCQVGTVHSMIKRRLSGACSVLRQPVTRYPESHNA